MNAFDYHAIVLKHEDVLAILNKDNVTDEKRKWMFDALKIYKEIYAFFDGWKGVSVVVSVIGSPAHKIEVVVNRVRAVDFYSGSKLEAWAMNSQYFSFQSSYDAGYMNLVFSFVEPKDSSKSMAFVDDQFGYDGLNDAIEKYLDITDVFDELDEKINTDELFEECLTSASSYLDKEKHEVASHSFWRLINTVCKLLSVITCGTINCPPEFAVICNEGTIRINAKVCDVDTSDIKKWLPALLNIASNIHVSHTDGKPVIDEDRIYADFDDSYLAFDISIDIPMLS